MKGVTWGWGGGGGVGYKKNVPNPVLKLGDEEKNNIKFIFSFSIS